MVPAHTPLSSCVAVPPVIVKEWSSGKAKSALTPELVPALCFREWTCPNLRRLWLGRASEDRSRRTRAFLACLRSDCPALLNPAQVPQHLLLMCCVLRYDTLCITAVGFSQPKTVRELGFTWGGGGFTLLCS